MKTVLAALVLVAASAPAPAPAAQLDSLKGLMGGGGGSLTSGSMSNAAGILQYCVTNNYLGGDSGASGVKDQLLGKLGGGDTQAASNDATGSSASDMLGRFTGKAKNGGTAAAPTQDKGYLDGARGLLKSGDGKTLDLGATGGSMGGGAGDLKAKLTRKVCDAVLKQGKGMLGMGK